MNVLRFADLVAAGQVAGRRVFIRADLNVPQDHSPEGGGRITEDTRIRDSVPCIEMALRAPSEGEPTPQDSLAPIAARLGELLARAVPLRTEWTGGVEFAPGEVVVLENCRLNKG